MVRCSNVALMASESDTKFIARRLAQAMEASAIHARFYAAALRNAIQLTHLRAPSSSPTNSLNSSSTTDALSPQSSSSPSSSSNRHSHARRDKVENRVGVQVISDDSRKVTDELHFVLAKTADLTLAQFRILPVQVPSPFCLRCRMQCPMLT
eukprot:3369439-Rhodomonas_salina.1